MAHKQSTTENASTKATEPRAQEVESFGPQPADLQRAVTRPDLSTPSSLLRLQRLAGNRAVTEMVGRQKPAKPATIQRLMNVGPADDQYEQEAEAIARQVQRAPDDSTRQPVGPEGGALDNGLEGKIRQAQSGGSSMPTSIRSRLEPKLGADLSSMKVHTGSQSAQLNRDLGAKAFTVKNHIFYGANQSPSNLNLTTHETVHSLQQGAVPRTQRRIEPNVSSSTTSVNQVQLKRDTAQDKDNLNLLRNNVLFKIEDGEWLQALEGMKGIGYNLSGSGFWGSMTAIKWTKGVSGMDTERKNAKALMSDTQKSDQEKLTKIKELGKSLREKATSSLFKASQWQHVVEIATKTAYYLLQALPATVRDMSVHLSGFTPDLDTVFQDSVDKGQGLGAQAKSQKVQSDERTLSTALTDGSMSGRGFHGSASWLLEGLGKSQGKLLSQQAAFDAGLLKTGEGTTFSSGASLKKDVYIGQGETGFSTAASYALAPSQLASYNVSLLSDAELLQMISDYERVLHLQALFESMDPTISSGIRSISQTKMKDLAIKAGINPDTDSGYAHMMKWHKETQLEDMLGKLQKEIEARKEWDPTDIRRQGGMMNPDNYPILLEFDLTGVDSSLDAGGVGRVKKGDYRLAGEATVKNEIDLTGGRLKVVYVPEQFITKTQLKLVQVFGNTHPIAVRSLESIPGSIQKGSEADKTLQATYGQLEKQQKSLDVKIAMQKQLSDDMLEYADKNDKSALHSSITKMMSSGIAPVKGTETPEALLMMGGPGSGKSTIIESILDPSERKNMVVADPDAIKSMLPSYQTGVKKGDKSIASKVHGESKQINSSLVDQTIIAKKNLLYDATGANKKEYVDLIKKLKLAGYKINLVYAHLDVEEGVRRVNTRAAQTGRDVPENIVRSIYRNAPRNFVQLVSSVDYAFVFDNNGRNPKLVWSTFDGSSLDESDLAGARTSLDLDE